MLTKTEQDLLARIDEESLIQFLQKLVQVGSENPPGNEEGCALLIEEELRSFGCHTQLQYIEPGRPNIIGSLAGDSREKVLLNGHTDTVKIGQLENWTRKPLGGEIIDNNLYGRGACDMKAGLVAMIFAMRAIAQSGIPRKRGILFTGVIDEEVNFKGTTALIEAGHVQDCSLGFVAEPTSLQIVTEHKGGIEYGCEVTGRSAHSGKAHQGINAIGRMAKVVSGYEAYNDALKDFQPSHPIFQTPTLNIGTISGGEGVTFVPEQCKIEFDRQVLPCENLQDVSREIADLTRQIGQEHGFELTLTKYQSFSPWQVSHSDEHVTFFAAVVADTLSIDPEFGGLHGYCEAELLSRANIPCLVFGPGNIDYAHAPDEHVAIRELIEATRVYAVALARFVSQENV
jgi:acetylornithine deacetylase/succinyl-diaminopimelate desuccinylase family protein